MSTIEDLTKQVLSEVGQKIKRVIKKLVIKGLIKLLPIILIVIGIIILVGGIVYLVKINDGSHNDNDKANTPHIVQEAMKEAMKGKDNLNVVSKGNGKGYKLDIDLDKVVDDIIETARKNEGRLNVYLSKKNEKEYLKNFIRAELVTQYPDLRCADDIGKPMESGELQGIVKVKREDRDNKEKILTYVDPSTFDSYVKSSSTDALSYFSLNDSGQIVVAGSTKTDTTAEGNDPNANKSGESSYQIQTYTIDYKQMLSKYTMPFDFLWALLVMSTNEDFTNEVAKLSLNSDIVVKAFDNVTTTVSENTVKYKEKDDTTVSVNYKDASGNVVGSTSKNKVTENDNNNYYSKTTTTTVSDVVSLQIAKADGWVATYTDEYKYEELPKTVTESDQAASENAEYKEVSNGGASSGDSAVQELLSECNSSAPSGQTCEISSASKKVSIKENGSHTKVTVTGNKYTSTTKSVKEKTDPNAKEPNFVTLCKKYYNALDNVMDAPDWFIKMLENGPKTSDMVDLVKYLLFKASGKNLGVKEFDFSIFDVSKFTSVSGGGTLELNSTNMSRDEFIQKVQGYSAAIANGGRTLVFRENAGVIYDVCKEQKINPVLCAVQGWKEQNWDDPSSSPFNYWGIAVFNGQNYGSKYPNMDAAVHGYCRTLQAYEEGGNMYNQVKATAQEFAKYNDKYTGNMQTLYDFLCIYACPDGNPTKQQCANYMVGYVNDLIKIAKQIFGEGALTGSGSCGGGDVSKAGLEVHKEEQSWSYSLSALTSGDIDRALNNPAHCTCCCTYVSCVLYRAGLLSHDEVSSINYNYCGGLYPLLEKKGWQKVAPGQLQAGDVVFYGPNNHTQIYAGNHTWFNAGSTGAIQGACPQQQGVNRETSFALAFRPPAAQKSQAKDSANK